MSGGASKERQAATEAQGKGERIAKVIARSGVCSRRDAERLIAEGRVALNGRALTTPAVTVGPDDRIEVNGSPLPGRDRTRLWLFNKPKGLVTTNRDPEGRPTVFSALPPDLPRVLTVGRLDINTEGLLLLTNDGGLARVLELPSTGWLRRYRVRAHGRVEQAALDTLRHGVTIEGMIYGAIEAEIERIQGSNIWLQIGLREGKNREVKRVLEHLGMSVTRLIRVSYGPFQLGDLADGEVREVRGRVLRDQLGEKLAAAAGADFDAPIRMPEQKQSPPAGAKKRPGVAGRRGAKESARTVYPSGKSARGDQPVRDAEQKARPRTDRNAGQPEKARGPKAADAPRAANNNGGRKSGGKARAPRSADRRRPP